jgi:hypothetical protein
LLEKGVAPVWLKLEVVLDRRSERFVALRTQVLFGKGSREPQFRLCLGLRRSGYAHAEQCYATGYDCTPIDRVHVRFLLKSREL